VEEIPCEVKIVSYKKSGTTEIMGYMPMIFGKHFHGSYSVLTSALVGYDFSWRDPREDELYATSAAAQAAWEDGEPTGMTSTVVSRAFIINETRDKIEELGLYREPAYEPNQEDADFDF